MLTIIIGAGASFDSYPEYPSVGQNPVTFVDTRLPLAKELFSRRFANIARAHPLAFPLFSSLRRANNIEHELERISADSSDPDIPKQLLAVRHYIHDVISTAQSNWNNTLDEHTTYYEFLNILRRWHVRTKEPVALITFNYDTLLDQAFTANIGVSLLKMPSYVQNRTGFQLFKPHGSINWVRVAKNVYSGTLYDSADKIEWSDEFVTDNENRPMFPSAPAIAIPTETKTFFEFPSSHLDEMKKAIEQTTVLITIGWRGAEKHFLKLWEDSASKRTIQKLQIVNSDQAKSEEIYDNIAKYGKTTTEKLHIFSDGFSKYVPNQLQIFLDSD